MTRLAKVALLLALAAPSATATAQPVAKEATGLTEPINGSVHAPKGSVAIPLYGKANPGRPSDEIKTRFMGRETVLRDITYPTLTPVLPDPEKANGTAVIVAPGGGFMMLSMQNEGWHVAQVLADHGIAAFVLKYRLLPTPKDDTAFWKSLARLLGGGPPKQRHHSEISDPSATQDVLAALKLLRNRSSDWHVDPHRVGIIGFSAGSMATLKAVLEAPTEAEEPDFIGYIYGPQAKVDVPDHAPPMFDALAMDDPLFGNGDWSIAAAWHAAKRPVELHVYQTGGHGFGLGRSGTTTTLMVDEFLAWLRMQGFLTPSTES